MTSLLAPPALLGRCGRLVDFCSSGLVGCGQAGRYLGRLSENWSWQLANQLSCKYWKGVMEKWSKLRRGKLVEAVGSYRAVGPRCGTVPR